MLAEIQEEKDRIAQQASRQRAEIDKLQQQLHDKHSYALEAMKSEFEKAREEQENRHAVSSCGREITDRELCFQALIYSRGYLLLGLRIVQMH